MSGLKKAQSKLEKLRGQLATEQGKRIDKESELAEMREGMGAAVVGGKSPEAVTNELQKLGLAVDVSGAVCETLAVSITEAESAVKDAQIVDFREQGAAKEKELAKHQAAVAKLLEPIFENDELAGLTISGGKAETAKARELASTARHLLNQAARLEQGLPLRPNIYEGMPERAPGFYPVQPVTVELP